MQIKTLLKVAKLLNDNNIQYRIGSYTFLGESVRFDGAGFSITIDDGDQGMLKIVRRTKTAQILETLKTSEMGSTILR